MKALALILAAQVSVCEVNPQRCEEVIRKQSVAIDVLNVRLDEAQTLLDLEKSRTSSLTDHQPTHIVEADSPWWVIVLAVAGGLALGAGVAVAVAVK